MEKGTFNIVVTCGLNGGTTISERVSGYIDGRFGICKSDFPSKCYLIVDIDTGKCIAERNVMGDALDMVIYLNSTMDDLTDIVQKS